MPEPTPDPVSSPGSLPALVLDNAGTGGAPGSINAQSIIDQLFAALVINAWPRYGTGMYDLHGGASSVPLVQTGALDGKGTGSLAVTGTYDPAGSTLSGTFTMTGSTSGTWAMGPDPASARPYRTSLAFSGELSGSIDNDIAAVSFDGHLKLTCEGDVSEGHEGCGGLDRTRSFTVWFDVSSPAYSTMPGATEPHVAYLWAAAGPVYHSTSSEKDPEPARGAGCPSCLGTGSCWTRT